MGGRFYPFSSTFTNEQLEEIGAISIKDKSSKVQVLREAWDFYYQSRKLHQT